MKRLKDKIEKTPEDKPCQTCANTFRACPMFMLLGMSRVSAGMEVVVVHCPDYREAGSAEEEAARATKSIGGLIRDRE